MHWVKWFQLDSDAPEDPRIDFIVQQFAVPNQALGALLRIWCYVADKGQEPGVGVNGTGQPFPLTHVAAKGRESVQFTKILLDQCAEQGHIDQQRWANEGVIVFPAMVNRGDTYTKRKRKQKRPSKGSVRRVFEQSPATVQDSTRHNTTKSKDPTSAGLTLDGPETVDELIRMWNTTVQRPLPRVTRASHERKQQYARRLKRYPNLADWKQIFVWMNTASWGRANGKSPHERWVFTLDWLTDKPGRVGEFLDRVEADQQHAGQRPESSGRTSSESGKYDELDG